MSAPWERRRGTGRAAAAAAREPRGNADDRYEPARHGRRPEKQEHAPGNRTHRERVIARRGRGQPGGFTAACGCRYARAGGRWVHVHPCRGHQLADPGEENMKAIMQEAA